MLKQEGVEEISCWANICNRFNFDLLDALKDITNVSVRKALIEKNREKLEDLRRRAPDSAEYARDLSISYERLGDLYRKLGEPPRALEYYKKALEIHEDLRRRAPDSAEYARDMVVSYYKIASFYQGQKDMETCLKYFQSCKEAILFMKTRGMYLDPPIENLLKTINQLHGESSPAREEEKPKYTLEGDIVCPRCKQVCKKGSTFCIWCKAPFR